MEVTPVSASSSALLSWLFPGTPIAPERVLPQRGSTGAFASAELGLHWGACSLLWAGKRCPLPAILPGAWSLQCCRRNGFVPSSAVSGTAL